MEPSISYGTDPEGTNQLVDLGKYFTEEELASFAPIEKRSYEAIVRRHLAIMRSGVSLPSSLPHFMRERVCKERFKRNAPREKDAEWRPYNTHHKQRTIANQRITLPRNSKASKVSSPSEQADPDTAVMNRLQSLTSASYATPQTSTDHNNINAIKTLHNRRPVHESTKKKEALNIPLADVIDLDSDDDDCVVTSITIPNAVPSDSIQELYDAHGDANFNMGERNVNRESSGMSQRVLDVDTNEVCGVDSGSYDIVKVSMSNEIVSVALTERNPIFDQSKQDVLGEDRDWMPFSKRILTLNHS